MAEQMELGLAQRLSYTYTMLQGNWIPPEVGVLLSGTVS